MWQAFRSPLFFRSCQGQTIRSFRTVPDKLFFDSAVAILLWWVPFFSSNQPCMAGIVSFLVGHNLVILQHQECLFLICHILFFCKLKEVLEQYCAFVQVVHITCTSRTSYLYKLYILLVQVVHLTCTNLKPGIFGWESISMLPLSVFALLSGSWFYFSVK